jgi:hypothetical protein
MKSLMVLEWTHVFSFTINENYVCIVTKMVEDGLSDTFWMEVLLTSRFWTNTHLARRNLQRHLPSILVAPAVFLWIIFFSVGESDVLK